MKSFAFIFLSLIGLMAIGQAPAFEDLIFEMDSISKSYKPNGKHFAFIRSKRGAGGVNKTSTGDSIVTKAIPVTDIYLVFTEVNPSEIATRETENRERWENLIKTYPEFFAESPNLYNMCQCAMGGNAETLKQTQGFYVYFEGKEEPVAVTPKAVTKKEEEKKAPEPVKKEEKVKKEKVKEEKPEKEEKTAKAEKAKKEEKVVKEEKPKKEKNQKEENPKEEVVKNEAPTPVEEAEVKEAKPRKEGFSKPKKAKDPKACRPPCYEGGDEDLFAFFKDNIPLTKKQKRHSKDLITVLRIQLNFDGTIKKTFVQGANEELNKLVTDAVKNMNTWNPAVKGGITVKSEVKMTLKYDNSTKAMKPFDTNIIPRPGPKCACVPDSQIFAD